MPWKSGICWICLSLTLVQSLWFTRGIWTFVSYSIASWLCKSLCWCFGRRLGPLELPHQRNQILWAWISPTFPSQIPPIYRHQEGYATGHLSSHPTRQTRRGFLYQGRFCKVCYLSRVTFWCRYPPCPDQPLFSWLQKLWCFHGTLRSRQLYESRVLNIYYQAFPGTLNSHGWGACPHHLWFVSDFLFSLSYLFQALSTNFSWRDKLYR